MPANENSYAPQMSNQPESPYFEIGAVAKITGLSPNTLRTWERRNFIQAGLRSPTGRRRYSQEQVEQLALMKRLTNMGDSISSISKLSLTELRSRVLEYETRHVEARSKQSATDRIRVLPIGKLASTWADILPNQFEKLSSDEENPGLLMVDLDASAIECRRRVSVAALENPDIPMALVYDYAPSELLRQFSKEGRFLIRIPCSPELLTHYLNAALANATHQADPTAQSDISFKSAPRVFTDKQLATIAASNPNIKCECPHHTSALVASLASFENYCRRCEIESPDDKEVHEYLGTEIGKARAIVEDALLYLCQKDNLVIPEDNT